jgi:hypothetical protein
VRISRRALVIVAGLAAALAIAIPVIGADPSGAPAPPGQAKPDKGPELERTIRGTVESAADADGRPSYTITAGDETWTLSAGPTWYWGDENPLRVWVGKTVEVAGTYHEGETELDVETVDGERLREPGKPPWAGGPWVQGEKHPGWKPWMADGKPGNGHGRDNAPGQQKKDATEDD